MPAVAVLIALVVMLLRQNTRQERQTVLDYQYGLLFEGGKPQEVLAPGRHFFRPNKEQITLVDLRDQPVLVERLAYPDSTGENAWVSVSAAIRIVDAILVTVKCSDHVNEAMVLIRDVVRKRLSARRASETRHDRRGCEQEITTHVASELGKIGLALTSLEITEVSSPGTDRAVAFSGVH
jgi:uncharacterized membrane protein YqiK